ncbi:MAG: 50S ribosomal protein L6 [Candidatus Micrarchaeota archaeon]
MIELQIPEGVQFSVEGGLARAKGKMGEVEREFRGSPVSIVHEGKAVKVSSQDSAVEGTVASHISNMFHGVLSGFEKRMVIRFAHFPVSVETKGQDLLIKNFLGEKKPRRAKLVGKVKVEVKGQDMRITGPDKEAVGQSAANIRTATRIREKDGRVFQDGIFMAGE